MTRREFVVKLTGGTVMLFAAMNGVTTLKAGDGQQRGQSHINPAAIPDHVQEILRLAAEAPSGHNTQPWIVDLLSPQHFRVRIDESRYLPEVDPDHRETLISMGCFIENLSLAAGNLGYKTEIEFIASETSDTDIADIRLAPHERRAFPIEWIEKRRTIRSGYENESIRPEDLAFLTESLSDCCTFYQPGSDQAAYIEDVTLKAFTKQTYRDSAQAELADWIRFSKGEIKEHQDGLTPATMEMPWIARVITGLFYDEENVMSENFRETGIKGVKNQLAQHGGWLVLTSQDSGMESLIEAGRRFQRIALKAREKSVALHPMSQALEEEPWKNQIAAELGIDGEVQFLLRVGYVKNYPEPVSPRRPVDWFVRA